MTTAEQWSRSISKERPWWESPLAAALLTAYPFFTTHACSAFPFDLFFPHLAPSLPLWPICCCPVAQSRPAPCKPMDRSMPDSSVLYYCPEFAQIHVHWVGGAIQSSHLLSPPFSSYLQSLPASGSFLMSQVFMSGGRSIRASASASVLPMNIQGWFPLGLTGLISLLSKELSNLLQHHTSKLSILSNWWKKAERKASFMVRLSHLYRTTRRSLALTVCPFCICSASAG